VSAEDYISDKDCWGGEEDRYKGIGLFSGDDNKRFFLLSKNCSTREKDYKFSAFVNLGILRISDKNGLILQSIGERPYSSNNFTTPVSIPGEEAKLYLADVIMKKIDSDGYVYFEVIQVNRLQSTDLSLGDLHMNFAATLRQLKRMDNAY
jgi:hypothetical protein